MVITSGKGKKARSMTMRVDYNKVNGNAKKSIDPTQSKKEAKASAKAAVKTANELFTDKILEYLKKYGEGEAVAIDEYNYGAQGVAYAKLIDFDGDGQDELLIEYSDESLENSNGATAGKAEVWACRDGEIEKVYEPDIRVDPMAVGVSLRVSECDGTYGFKRYLHDGKKINFKEIPGGMNDSHDGYECEFDAYDGKTFGAIVGPVSIDDSKVADINEVREFDVELFSSEEVVAKSIATVATTLEQLKSKNSDDAQASYEAVSAAQDVDFTTAVGEGPLNPSPDDTCQITATWTYPQVKGQGVGVAKFNKDMVQLVADTLDASRQASMDDEDSRVTMMYTAEIVSIDGDIACVRTFTDSYQPPYRSERVTRSAYYNLKTGEQVSLEDSLAQHGLSYDTLKSEAKQAIKTAKPNMDSVSEDNIDDDDNYTEDHFYYDGKGYIVVLDTGEFDCMAWDTHDLVAHAFDSSYSSGQDVTPERARATYVPNE